MSYYDSWIGMKENAVFLSETAGNYDDIYQYDPKGWTGSIGYGSSSGWFANIFTARSNSQVAAVAFFTTGTDSSYTIRIYTDPKAGPINAAGFTTTQSGSINFAGYHTIKLNSAVDVTVGQKFSVVVGVTTPGATYPIPLEMTNSLVLTGANPGESYISSSGDQGAWSDITGSYPTANVCVKAFVVTQPDTPAFSPDGGTLVSPASVKVSCSNPNAEIHYTTNGIDPTMSDPIVTSGSSVVLDHSVTLKARAFRTGATPSAVKSAAYTVLQSVTIADAKRKPNGASVACKAEIVTAAFPNSLYIESIDREAGILVVKTGHGLQQGMKVDVIGTIRTNSSGERYIDPSYLAQSDVP